jgi:signal peptidase I
MKDSRYDMTKYKRTIFLLAGFIAILILVRIFLFSVYTVHGISMENTLRNGDRVLVHKKKRLSIRDVVVISDKNSTYIKRIVALPGDTVRIKNKVLYINNNIIRIKEETWEGIEDTVVNPMVLEHYGMAWTLSNFGPVIVPKKGMPLFLTDTNKMIYSSVLSRDMEITDQEVLTKQLDGMPVYTFKSDYCFLVGDNRLHSDDSRSLGFFPVNSRVGVAKLILYNKQWNRILKSVY